MEINTIPNTFSLNEKKSPLATLLAVELRERNETFDIKRIEQILEIESVRRVIKVINLDLVKFKLYLELNGWTPFKNAFINGNLVAPNIIVLNEAPFDNIELICLTDEDNSICQEILSNYNFKEAVKSVTDEELLNSFTICYDNLTPPVFFRVPEVSYKKISKGLSIKDNVSAWTIDFTHDGSKIIIPSLSRYHYGWLIFRPKDSSVRYMFYISKVDIHSDNNYEVIYRGYFEDNGNEVPADVVDKDIKEFFNQTFIEIKTSTDDSATEDIKIEEVSHTYQKGPVVMTPEYLLTPVVTEKTPTLLERLFSIFK